MRTKTQLIAAAAAVTFITATTASAAVLIGFESSEGYVTGSLDPAGPDNAQPTAGTGTDWSVAGDSGDPVYNVTSGVGVGSSNGLVMDPNNFPASGSPFADFQATAADWGVPSLSNFDGTATVSFDIDIEQLGTSGANAFVLRPFGGTSTSPGEVRFRANGAVRLQAGSAQQSQAGGWDPTAGFQSFSITADYTNQTLTLTGASLPSAGLVINSFAPNAGPDLGAPRLTLTTQANLAQVGSVTLDNINISATPIPEPASALAALGMLGALGIRRRR
ncbi:MAG: hypothetical protein AAF743_07020 [Planctomycetota bacterium]